MQEGLDLRPCIEIHQIGFVLRSQSFAPGGRPLISANRDRRNKYKEVKTIRDTADHIHTVELYIVLSDSC